MCILYCVTYDSKQVGVMQDVEARRAEVRKYQSNPEYKKKVDDERRAKKKAEVMLMLNGAAYAFPMHIPYHIPHADGHGVAAHSACCMCCRG